MPIRPLEKSAEVLWAKSILQPDGCMVWTGYLTQKGYGQINYGGKNVAVHRLAYLLMVGPIPAGKHVLHSCDNRACVNVAHFFLGTNQDNILDKCRKGRARKKLDIAAVLEIRRLASLGYSHRELAVFFGVHQSNVSRAVSRERWKHIKSAEGGVPSPGA